ncbi:MAG: RNA polymerase factor sigma-32 [Alphaproteobacteria bacterium]
MAHIDDPATQRANMSYIRASMKEALLSREDEQDLAKRWRYDGDEDALHRLVRAYTRLVISTATKFRNYGLPMGDLVQEGNIGLMQAAARFDPEREVRFSTYATWWIRSAIQDYVLRNWSIVRTGTTSAQKSLFFNLRRLRARIAEGSGGLMTDEGRQSISKELKVGIHDVESMEARLSGSDHSLNATVSDMSNDPWQDLLPDERPTPDQVVTCMRDSETRSKWLAAALDELSDREQVIIQERRLVDDGATLEELGRKLGVSKERVRQLETRAMSKLKQAILRNVDRPTDLLMDA